MVLAKKTKVVHHENGYGANKFMKTFLNKNWSPSPLSPLNTLLTTIHQTGTVDCKSSSGKSIRRGLLRMLTQPRSWY